MRRSVLFFLLAILALLLYLLHSVSTLISLLFETGAADAILASDIPPINSSLVDALPKHIPKIIHQTYVNNSIPERWQEPWGTCQTLHPDYEYMLWTDTKSHAFIAKEYPWFLPTFTNYRHPIQRADAIRYFVLDHFGGTYIDLDDGCNRRLDPLLTYPSWLHRTNPTGISNDAMAATPHHPFFQLVLANLQRYDRNWGLPYITVMYSTGPLFLSVLWKEYMSSGLNTGDGADGGRVRVLAETEYHEREWSFFLTFLGSSWHEEDARVIFWMGDHWLALTVAGVVGAGVAGVGMWFLWRAVVRGLGGGAAGVKKRRYGRKGSWSWPWMRYRSRKYERVDRHEV